MPLGLTNTGAVRPVWRLQILCFKFLLFKFFPQRSAKQKSCTSLSPAYDPCWNVKERRAIGCQRKGIGSLIRTADHSWLFQQAVWSWGLPRSLSGKESVCQCRIDPCVSKTPYRRKRQPTPVFLPGKSHGKRSLVGSPWGCKRVRHNLVTKQQHVVTEPLSHLPAPSFQHQLAETAEPNSTEVSLQH